MKLRVNPIACTGHGVCAELLPELIEPDPWGYPLVADAPVPADLLDLAKRAVAGCPTLALLTDDSVVASPAGVRRGGRHASRA